MLTLFNFYFMSDYLNISCCIITTEWISRCAFVDPRIGGLGILNDEGTLGVKRLKSLSPPFICH